MPANEQIMNLVQVINKLARRHKLGLVIRTEEKARVDKYQSEFYRRWVIFSLYAQLSVRLRAFVRRIFGGKEQKRTFNLPINLFPSYPVHMKQLKALKERMLTARVFSSCHKGKCAAIRDPRCAPGSTALPLSQLAALPDTQTRVVVSCDAGCKWNL